MNSAVTVEFLKTLAFLSPATDEELNEFVAVSRRVEFAPGSILFREGENVGRFEIVESGIVAIEIVGRDRRFRRIHTVSSGELLGWSPLLGSAAMTATARALSSVRVVSFDARAILAICDADPSFGYQFMRRVAAAIAARLHSTRLQLLDVFGSDMPIVQTGGTPA